MNLICEEHPHSLQISLILEQENLPVRLMVYSIVVNRKSFFIDTELTYEQFETVHQVTYHIFEIFHICTYSHSSLLVLLSHSLCLLHASCHTGCLNLALPLQQVFSLLSSSYVGSFDDHPKRYSSCARHESIPCQRCLESAQSQNSLLQRSPSPCA